MGAPKSRKFQETLSIAPLAPPDAALGFEVRVISRGEASGQALARELEAALRGWIPLRVQVGAADGGGTDAQVYFVDGEAPDLDARLAALDRGDGERVFLVVREDQAVPAALIEGRVDDILVYPFRSLEVLSKLRHFQKTQADRAVLEEVRELNAAYAHVVESLREDLKLAERLQKQRLPRRFPDVKGFRVTSRYLAGERSGGDYVDMAETRDGQNLAIIMTDASTYRLSSAVLDTVTRRLASIPADETRSCVTAARRIRDGVLMTLGDRDQLSLFYAVLSRKDYRLRFLNLGGTRVFYASPGRGFAEVTDGQGEPIVKAMGVRTETEGELLLEPEGRLALVSDGFVESVGGAGELIALFDRHRTAVAADSLNELVFITKRPLTGPDDLPAQDCTAVLFDVDSRLIRLA